MIAHPFYESGPREPSHSERVIVASHRFRRPGAKAARRLGMARRFHLGFVVPAAVAAGSIYGVVATQPSSHHPTRTVPGVQRAHQP